MTDGDHAPRTGGAARAAPGPDDPLLRRYAEASALDPAGPGPAVRDAVLRRARAAAANSQAPQIATKSIARNDHLAGTFPGNDQKFPAPRPAANDRAWRLRLLASLAVLGLATLLVLQFERGTSPEREAALGTRPARPTAAPELPQSPPPVATADTPPDRTPAAKAAPRPVTQAGRAPPVPLPAPPPPRAPDPTAKNDDATPTRGQTASVGDEARAPGPLAAETSTAPALPLGRERRAEAGAALRTAPAEATPAPTRAATPAAPPAAPATAAADAAGHAAPRRDGDALALPAADARLLVAAARGERKAVRAALAAGARIEAADAAGRTALMLAAQQGDEALAALLLDAGADRRRADREGLTAADHARRAGHAPLAERLAPTATPTR